MVSLTPTRFNCNVKPEFKFCLHSKCIMHLLVTWTLGLIHTHSDSISSDGLPPMYLDELKDWIDTYVTNWHIHPMLTVTDLIKCRHITRELPGSVPFSAKAALMIRSFENWEDLTKDCSAKVFSATESLAIKLVEKHFNRFSFSALDEAVKCVWLIFLR